MFIKVWTIWNKISPVVVWGDTSVGILEGRSGPGVCPVTVVKEAFIEDKDVDARDGRKVDEVPI